MARLDASDWTKKEALVKIQGWARDGLSDEQIADNIGIARQTLHRWRKKHNAIEQAMKIGKDVADRQVENAMFKSAIGHTYKEDVVTNDGRVVTVNKYSKPNVTAQIFWLKNRKTDTWRDKTEQQVEHSGGVNIYDDYK